MNTTSPTPPRDEPADAGTVAFLIFYAVLMVVLTGALWITYLS